MQPKKKKKIYNLRRMLLWASFYMPPVWGHVWGPHNSPT